MFIKGESLILNCWKVDVVFFASIGDRVEFALVFFIFYRFLSTLIDNLKN